MTTTKTPYDPKADRRLVNVEDAKLFHNVQIANDQYGALKHTHFIKEKKLAQRTNPGNIKTLNVYLATKNAFRLSEGVKLEQINTLRQELHLPSITEQQMDDFSETVYKPGNKTEGEFDPYEAGFYWSQNSKILETLGYDGMLGAHLSTYTMTPFKPEHIINARTGQIIENIEAAIKKHHPLTEMAI